MPEQNTVDEWYSRAKRAYEERAITYKNVIVAKAEIEKIREFFRTRIVPEEMTAKVDSLKTLVEEEFKAMVKEIWFDAERDFQLSKYAQAKEKYQSLLEMYPDHSSAENIKINQILETIKELMK